MTVVFSKVGGRHTRDDDLGGAGSIDGCVGILSEGGPT